LVGWLVGWSVGWLVGWFLSVHNRFLIDFSQRYSTHVDFPNGHPTILDLFSRYYDNDGLSQQKNKYILMSIAGC